jgi:hypothetical protein
MLATHSKKSTEFYMANVSPNPRAQLTRQEIPPIITYQAIHGRLIKMPGKMLAER